jgi:hypothetical protein
MHLLLIALLATSSYPIVRTFAVDPIWWQRHVAVIHVHIEGKERTAIVDTGGYTQLRSSSPRDFEGYYRGLPIDAAIGADILPKYVMTLGRVDPSREVLIALRVQSFRHERYAFLPVVVGDQRLTMLLDTGALAWAPSDISHRHPFGISFLRASVFEDLRRRHPGWPFFRAAAYVIDAQGKFVLADAVEVPSITVGSITAGPVRFIERADDTTYATLRKIGNIEVSGDLGLDAFNPVGLCLDISRSTLGIGRER